MTSFALESRARGRLMYLLLFLVILEIGSIIRRSPKIAYFDPTPKEQMRVLITVSLVRN